LLAIARKRCWSIRGQLKVFTAFFKIIYGLRVVVTKLTGHLDYSFSCAFSPDDLLFSTGNQDKTTRLYDVRFPAQPLKILPARMSAIRSLQFSSDGAFLIAAEPGAFNFELKQLTNNKADFVHIYSVKDAFESSQTIDFFGEIAGVAVTPDCQSLFIANAYVLWFDF
jgi:WD40 repeat protein